MLYIQSKTIILDLDQTQLNFLHNPADMQAQKTHNLLGKFV